ncbi:MAG: ABC transporter permease [Anaerolineae bacterium]
MSSFLRFTAFTLKESYEILRQPILIGSLILGPFAILLIFGVGYTGRQPSVRLGLIMPPNEPQIAQMVNDVKRYNEIDLVLLTTSEQEAHTALLNGTVEIVAAIPANAAQEVRNGKQVEVKETAYQVDPVRVSYAQVMTQFVVDYLNRQLLAEGAKRVQDVSGTVDSYSTKSLDDLIKVIGRVNSPQYAKTQEDITRATAVTEGLIKGYDRMDPSTQAAVSTIGAASGFNPTQARTQLANLRDSLIQIGSEMKSLSQNASEYQSQLEDARTSLAQLQTAAKQMQAIPAETFIAPVVTQFSNIARFQPTYIAFYAPAVLALLLQHLAVTFGALSLVRERTRGTQELFSVAPITAGEVVVGKYSAYMLILMAVAAILTVLMLAMLRVPMLGSWPAYILVALLVCLASLGWGFFISVISETESQAVQFAMLLLLASIFFGGFFLPLPSLEPVVRIISYLLPVTYGTQALQEIMLTARLPQTYLWVGLCILSLVLFVFTVGLYRRQTARS